MVQGKIGKRICHDLKHYLLALGVQQSAGEVFLGQKKYVIEILRRFQMMDCKPMATPVYAIEILMRFQMMYCKPMATPLWQ